MKRFLGLVVFLTLVMLAPQTAHAIVYGVPDDGHRYVGTFVGAIVDPVTGEDLLFQLCTGTLIDDDVVLSASHCFVGLEEFGVTDVTFTLAPVVDAGRDGWVDSAVPLRRRAQQSFGTGWRRMEANQELLSVTKTWATFSMNQATGNGGTCHGDSGGPHLLGDVVGAVTVTGDAMGKATDETYRVDTVWARTFLAQYVTVP